MADYSDERVQHLLVNDLADNLGNLLMRVTSRQLVLPQVRLTVDHDVLPLWGRKALQEDCDLLEALQQLPRTVGVAYDNYEFSVGLEAIMACLRKVSPPSSFRWLYFFLSHLGQLVCGSA